MLKEQDDIQKALEKLLEDKRGKFPRFYFLSNDELLKILANSKDLAEIEKNLNKVFDNVCRYQYKETTIDALFSNEGEELKLKGTVKTGAGNKSNGPEVWMEDIRKKMCEAVSNGIREAGRDYQNNIDTQPRKEWVLKFMGQSICA